MDRDRLTPAEVQLRAREREDEQRAESARAVRAWNEAHPPPPPTVEQRTEVILRLLDALTQEQRVEFFSDLKGEYCMHCSERQPEGPMRCQCWNDE